AGFTFVDARHGWLATSGSFSAMIVTDDGGVSWRLAKLPDGNIVDADLFGTSHGVMVTIPGQSALVRTDDNGATWKQLFPAPTPIWSTTFVDIHNGFGIRTAIDSSAVLRTSDGGRSWRQVGRVVGPCDSSIFELKFVDL